MQRICFFNSVRFWGGGEKLHLDHAIGCRELGYSVVMACDRDGALWKRASAAGIECVHVRVRNLSFLSPFALRSIARVLLQIQPDAVVFTTSQDVKAGAPAARRAGVERIVYLRGLAAPVKNSFINRRLFTSTLTHIIANSEETRRLMLQDMQQVSGLLPVQVVYHGIDTELPDTTTKHPLIAQKGSGIILGNAGRLTKQKGQMDLLAVAAILRDRKLPFTLFIAGEGEERGVLEQQIASLQLQDQVVLMGFVEDMPAFMRSIDIFLLSSHWEGFGFVLAEAMANQKPVVAYSVSSNPEIVEQGVTGILVPQGDIPAFAAAVMKLAEDPVTRNDQGVAGRARVLEKFSFSRQLNALLNAIGFDTH